MSDLAEQAFCLVSAIGADIVGFVNGYTDKRNGQNIRVMGVLESLYVAPEARGQGISRYLGRAAIRWLSEHGADAIRTDTSSLLFFVEREGHVEDLVAEGEQALYVHGDLVRARRLFTEAYALAEAADDARLMGVAAIGLGGLSVHEARPAALAAAVETRQLAALERQEPGSVLALRLRTRLAADANFRTGEHDTVLAMVEEARTVEAPTLLAEALSLAHHCLLGPEHASTRLDLAEELLRVAAWTDRPSDLAMGLLWRCVDLFTLGDPHAERSLTELSAVLEARPNVAVGWVVASIKVMLCIRSGRLVEAEGLAGKCAELAQVTGDPQATGCHTGHLIAIRVYQGRLAELAEALAELETSPLLSPQEGAALAACAVAAATAGDHRTARHALSRLRGRDWGLLPKSTTWLATMHGVVAAAALLGDSDTAARVYDLLLPFAHLPIMNGLGVICYGSAHHPLGVAALTMGDTTRAITHLRAAIEHNTALGHWPAAAWSRHRLSQALALLGETRAAEAEFAAAAAECATLGIAVPSYARVPTAAVCTRERRQWRIDLRDRSVVVSGSVGMRHLATLTANPGVEIPAVQLATSNGHAVPSGIQSQAVLDDTALRQYRQRLRELREELDEADNQHDIERAARLRAEADWVASELNTATGLGGRVRGFADNPERARIAVGKAIRRALDSITAADQALGDELRSTIQTGTHCCYRPRLTVGGQR